MKHISIFSLVLLYFFSSGNIPSTSSIGENFTNRVYFENYSCNLINAQHLDTICMEYGKLDSMLEYRGSAILLTIASNLSDIGRDSMIGYRRAEIVRRRLNYFGVKKARIYSYYNEPNSLPENFVAISIMTFY